MSFVTKGARKMNRGRKARMAVATTGVHGSAVTRRTARNETSSVRAPSRMLKYLIHNTNP